MRSDIAKRILDNTPEETKIFARRYAALVARLHEALSSHGLTQKDLADKLGKQPSEINKWLKSENNLTLKSIAKLEAELGERFLEVPPAKVVWDFPERSAKIRYCCHGYHSKIGNLKLGRGWDSVKSNESDKFANVG